MEEEKEVERMFVASKRENGFQEKKKRTFFSHTKIKNIRQRNAIPKKERNAFYEGFRGV
jgi:hypothetical protein